MSQCAGRTQKGDRCKREAREGTTYCSIHQEQEARPRSGPESQAASSTLSQDPDWLLKAALGVAAIVVIVLFRIRR